jgi:hypothetical protein
MKIAKKRSTKRVIVGKAFASKAARRRTQSKKGVAVKDYGVFSSRYKRTDIGTYLFCTNCGHRYPRGEVCPCRL